MFRFTYVGGIAAIIVFIMMSCTSEQPTSPLESLPDRSLNLKITQLDSTIIAEEGELYPAAFEVIVTDEEHLPAADVAVMIAVVSGPGSVAPNRAFCDRSGVVRALFYMTVPYGDTTVTIRAYAGIDSTSHEIAVHGDAAPAELWLSASPGEFRPFYGRAYEGRVNAAVFDRRGNPIQGRNISFFLLDGEAVLQGYDFSDEQGEADASVQLDGHWFGVLQIAAVVNSNSASAQSVEDAPASILKDYVRKSFNISTADSYISDTLAVRVTLASEVGLHISTSDTIISNYFPKNWIDITVRLSDEAGHPLPGETIEFSSDPEFLLIQQTAFTDWDGVIMTRADLTGQAGITTITARFTPLYLIDSLTVEILDRCPTSLVMMMIPDTMDRIWADSTYSITVRALDENNMGMVGVMTKLVSMIGMRESEPVFTDNSGHAAHNYTPVSGGMESLYAITEPSGVTSAPIEFRVYEEPARFSSELIRCGENDEFRVYDVYVGVLDTNDAFVPGEEIRMVIDIGWLSENQLITGSGRAMFSIFHDPDRSGGVATLTVIWRSKIGHTTINLPARPRTGHIEYDLSPSRISPPGVGALDTTAQFTLWIADDEGDTLRDVYAIGRLNLMTRSPPPWGCTIDGELSAELHTELGVARATIYSGTSAGSKLFTIRCWLYESPQDTISQLLSLLVKPGPPEIIELDIHVCQSDREYYYLIYPSVRLYDRHRNAVEEADRISYTYVPPDVTVETESLLYGGELEWNWQPGSDVSVTAEVESHNVLLRAERTVRIPQ
ncbi:Ig-like domain-containing protein [bacterium]|nr:Ig-like domain-containing protein [bacterium]